MKKWLLLIVVMVALALLPAVALAHSTPTQPPWWSGSYKVVSPDGKYVLVMLDGVYEKPGRDVAPETDEKNQLLLKYPTSGLYRNDGSSQLLWAMQYISWRQRITLSSDGHHLVVWGGWSYHDATYSNTAFSFYEDSKLLTTYSVRDLVAYPEDLPDTAGHYEWLLDDSFNDARGLLTIETYNHEKYVFSLNTGQPISSYVPTPSAGNSRSNSTGVAMSTVVPELGEAQGNAQKGRDDTMAMGLVFSAGTLTGVFAGVQLLSGKARRRRRHSDSFHLSVPQPAALRLKSRARGSKVALRRLRANPRKWTL
jgi:hypothetical protein